MKNPWHGDNRTLIHPNLFGFRTKVQYKQPNGSETSLALCYNLVSQTHVHSLLGAQERVKLHEFIQFFVGFVGSVVPDIQLGQASVDTLAFLVGTTSVFKLQFLHVN
jgi:hypothetical protein